MNFFLKLYKLRYVQSLINVFKTKHFRYYIYALAGNTGSGKQENEGTENLKISFSNVQFEYTCEVLFCNRNRKQKLRGLVSYL